MCLSLRVQAQDDSIQWHVEWQGTGASGRGHAPLWLASGNYGLSSTAKWSQYVLVGGHHERQWREHWQLIAGADIALTQGMNYNPWVIQQAYFDVRWRRWTLSIGSKKRNGSTLQKDLALSMGQMLEGDNILPIPQMRMSIEDFWPLHWVNDWVAFKGHLAYGVFTDGQWQEDFAAVGQQFTQGVLYHSKSAALRFGRHDLFPLTVEVGITDFAQFGGGQYEKNASGKQLKRKFDKGFENYLKAILPLQESTIQNVEGNHAGAWTAAIVWQQDTWKLRAYLDHFFDDHSQLTLQYGIWKDGQIGLELTLPKSRYLKRVLIESMDSRDQTTGILYDGVASTWKEIQWSGGDNYFNNGEFLAMHHWGKSMGLPLFAGPEYNVDHSIRFRSNRARARLVGLSGHLSPSVDWMAKVSWMKHWGTHRAPFVEPQEQWSTKVGMDYHPKSFSHWSFNMAVGCDQGDYMGNSWGATLGIRWQSEP